MIKIFDSHAHLDSDYYNADRKKVISNACEQLEGIINPGTDMTTSKMAIEFADQYENIYAAVGFHPHDAKKLMPVNLPQMAKMAEHPKVVAIGEIGLDYYYNHSVKESQQRAFIKQLELAKSVNLPVIIHDRDAHGDIMDILKTHAQGVTGVFHCYSGSLEMARELIKMNFYIAFGGSTTFKNANKLREVVRYVPTERLMVETDSPYLTPEPHRGKRNTPEMAIEVLQYIAQERNQDAEELAMETNENIYDLFYKIPRKQ